MVRISSIRPEVCCVGYSALTSEYGCTCSQIVPHHSSSDENLVSRVQTLAANGGRRYGEVR